MPAPANCPQCQAPCDGDVCLHCALTAALAGVTTNTAGASSGNGSDALEKYQLLEELGRGATATVWLAHDRSFDRLVALKLISASADPRLIQRLVREGQAVARLRHPNIVAVQAMHAADREAYLAMDYVEGGDLRQRLARGLPTEKQSATWVRDLASALAHAHANGVLHRDIKPSNILLTGSAAPQLADFGLAAPLEGGGDLTAPGQVAGTAAYLAPELLAGADRATPQSDLYSLGAVLYECLTGRAPFLGDSTAELFAQIANTEPPPPRILRPGIPRDLETICLKCLEKNPARRYATAQALQDDLDRALRGDAIAARPIGRVEKTARWCRKHPGTAVFGSIAAVLLLCLAIGGPLVAIRLARANARATAEAATSNAVRQFLQNDLLAQASPEAQADRDLKLRVVLDRAAKGIEGRFPGQPIVEADVRDTLAATYHSLGEYATSREQWERVRALRRTALGPDHPQTLRAGSNLVDALRLLGRYPEAEAIAVEVLRDQRRVLGSRHADTLLTISNLALVHRFQGKFPAAHALYTEALETQRQTLGPEHPATLAVMNNLAVAYRNEGRIAEAEALQAETVRLRTRILGPEHPDTLLSMNNLALIYKNQGKLALAEPLCADVLAVRQRVLGPEHPYSLLSATTLATILHDQAKLAEAEALYRQTIEIQRRKLGLDHHDTLVTMNNLGTVLRDRGNFAEAVATHTIVLEGRMRMFGPKSPLTLNSMLHLARAHFDQQQIAEAKRIGTTALTQAEQSQAPTHPITLLLLEFVGGVLQAEGDLAQAETLLRRAVDGRVKTAPRDWQTASAQSQLGGVLLALGRLPEAEPLLVQGRNGLTEQADKVPASRRREIQEAAERVERLQAEQARRRGGASSDGR